MLAADAGAAVSDSGAVVSQSTAEVAPVQSSVCTVDESATKSIVFIDAGVEDIDALSSGVIDASAEICLLYTSPSPRDATLSRMPSSA